MMHFAFLQLRTLLRYWNVRLKMCANLFPEKSVTRQRFESTNLLRYANENREKGFFNDVNVCIGDYCIPANSLVLSCKSTFFERSLKAVSNEEFDRAISIEVVDSDAVKAIIDYFYSESICITSDTVLSLLTASEYLQVEDLKKICLEFLESIISPENFFTFLNASKLHQIDAFTDWIYQYISEHLNEIAATTDFKCLCKLDLIECLIRGKGTNLEEAKIKALITWIKYDQEIRQAIFVELFQLLMEDLVEVTIEFMEDVLLKETSIRDNVGCFEKVLTAYSEILKRKSSTVSKFKETKVISLGGVNTRKNVFDVFDTQGSALLNYPKLPMDVYSHCCLKVDDFVFCIGGETSKNFCSETLGDIWWISMKHPKPEWRNMESMNEKRCDFGAAVHKGNLVVVGGSKAGTTLDSSEMYEVRSDRWSRQKSSRLKQSRKRHALVSCQGSLYAIGGQHGNNELSTVERLQDWNEKWSEVESMLTPRLLFAAVGCNGMIYAIGGQTLCLSVSATNTVERFDPTTGKWSSSQAMKNQRYGHSACVLNGKIIVVGGRDASLSEIREIECYDPSSDTWCVVGGLMNELLYHSIVAV